MKKMRLYIGLNGVLAELQQFNNIDMLYEKGFFANLNPLPNVLEGVREFIAQVNRQKEIEVFILSSVLKESDYAVKENNQWVDKYIPEIDYDHRIFMNYGNDKFLAIEKFDSNCILLDDYVTNLQKWDDMGGIAIKVVNPINSSNHIWKGAYIDYTLNPILFAYTLKRLIMEGYVKKNSIKGYDQQISRMMNQKRINNNNSINPKTKGVSESD